MAKKKKNKGKNPLERLYRAAFPPDEDPGDDNSAGEQEYCLSCGAELDSDGQCPNDCTDSDDYSFLEGFYNGVPDEENESSFEDDEEWDE